MSNEQYIHNDIFEGCFTRIANATINDRNLSDKELGRLVRMLSNKPTWKLTVRQMLQTKEGEQEWKDKKDSVYASIKTLKEHGYVVTKPSETRAAGRFSKSDYYVYGLSKTIRDRGVLELNTAPESITEPCEIKEISLSDNPPNYSHRVGLSDRHRSDNPTHNKNKNNTTNSNNLNNNQPLSSTPRENLREGEFDLSFLPDKDAEAYRDSILDELQRTPSDQIDSAYVRILRGQHRGTAPLSSLLRLQTTFGHNELVAAMVYAKSEGNGTASLKFLQGILKRWQKTTSSTTGTSYEVYRAMNFRFVDDFPEEYREQALKDNPNLISRAA